VTEQPRTPAGSPEGGQFATTAGAESTEELAERPAAPQRTPEQVAAIVAKAQRASERGSHLGMLSYYSDLAYYDNALNDMARLAKFVCPEATTLHFSTSDDWESAGTVRLDRVSCPHVSEDDGTDEVDGYDGDFARTHGVDADIFGDIRYDLNDGQMQLHKSLQLSLTDNGLGYTADLTTFTIRTPEPMLRSEARNELELRERSYAQIGLKVAALLGSNREWNGGDMLEAIGEITREHGLQVGDQDDATLAKWRALADSLGYAHDGDEA